MGHRRDEFASLVDLLEMGNVLHAVSANAVDTGQLRVTRARRLRVIRCGGHGQPALLSRTTRDFGTDHPLSGFADKRCWPLKVAGRRVAEQHLIVGIHDDDVILRIAQDRIQRITLLAGLGMQPRSRQSRQSRPGWSGLDILRVDDRGTNRLVDAENTETCP
jgi:hypothetical protein